MVNGTTAEIVLNNDYIINGERNKVTTSISAAPDPRKTTEKPMAYPCGILLYSKVSAATRCVSRTENIVILRLTV